MLLFFCIIASILYVGFIVWAFKLDKTDPDTGKSVWPSTTKEWVISCIGMSLLVGGLVFLWYIYESDPEGLGIFFCVIALAFWILARI